MSSNGPYILKEKGEYYHICSTDHVISIEERRGNTFIKERILLSAERVRNKIFILCEDHLKAVEVRDIRGNRLFRVITGDLDVKQGRVLEYQGRLKIILALGAAFMPKSHHDRQIRMYDTETGTLEWKNEIASNPQDLYLRDIDGDGIKEILVTTQSVANVVFVSGYSDFNTSAFCFNMNGELVWERSIPKIFSGSTLVFSRSGKLFMVSRDTFFRKWSKVTAMDPLSGKEIVSREFEFSLSKRCIPFDLDNDGSEELIFGTTDKRILALNSGLEVILSKKIGQFSNSAKTEINLNPLLASDLNGDGVVNFIFSLQEGILEAKDPACNEYGKTSRSFIITNDRFEIIDQKPAGRAIINLIFTDIFSKGQNEIWVY